MKTSLFDYHLPENLIAQKSAQPKDHSRLLVLDKKSGAISHHRFFEIGKFLRKGDLLVLNDTKVFRARLEGALTTGNRQSLTAKKIEVFLLRCVEKEKDASRWETLAQPGKKIKVGTKVFFTKKIFATAIGRDEARGTFIFEFPLSEVRVFDFLEKRGSIPTPPYAKEAAKKLADYQTVYAKHRGSVAAPTAGFHFTKRLLRELKKRGIETAYVTLHVGLGTFRPMKTETIEAHEMHEEMVEITPAAAKKISQAKAEGRRVIAVGTTATRALEAAEFLPNPPLKVRGAGGVMLPHKGPVNLFITPGFSFRVIDGLITNFHLPKSTLLVLVSSFAGRENILRAYAEAVKKKYRFYSFGDAMFIV